MKKKTMVIGLMALLGSIAFAKPKVQKFVFDFSKDFYPGIGYVYLNDYCFKDSVFVKADVIKNEYIIEKVKCTAALVPITLTLKVNLEKDGSLSYDYSDLKYVNDGSSTQLTPLVLVSSITNAFDKLLPQVFSDESKYNAAKAKFYTNPGMLFAMTDGLTEIRAAKFSEMVQDAPVDLSIKVYEAKMNDFSDYSGYKYYVRGSIYVSTLSRISFMYFTNDDDKASSSQGDTINLKGKIKEFKKYGSFEGLSFVVLDE